MSSFVTTLHNINKMDGSNFPFWKQQIWHVLVQKKHTKPIKLKGVKLEDMKNKSWVELDELACLTIMLTLAKSVYFNVPKETSSYGVCQKLCGLYEKESATSIIYWLKKLVYLKMKEGIPMFNHLNEFKTIFSQLLV